MGFPSMYNLAEQKLEHTNLHEIALHEDSFSLTVNTGWHCRLRAWENGALDTNCRQMWLTTVGLPAGTPTEWSLWISVRRWQTECLTYSNLQHHVAAVTVKTMSRLRSCRGGGAGKHWMLMQSFFGLGERPQMWAGPPCRDHTLDISTHWGREEF